MTETVVVDGGMLALEDVVDEASFARAAASLVAAVVSGVVFWDLSLSLSFLGDRAVRKARRMEWGRSFMVGRCLLAYLFWGWVFVWAQDEGELIMGVR